MRTCPSCELQIDGDFAFCPHCGVVLAETLQREQRKVDAIDAQGWARADLAEVLAMAGRVEEGGREFEESIARFVQKGDVMVERTRDRLAALREDTSA